MIEPYLDHGDVQLYLGDAIEALAALPAESVHAVITDPPYGVPMGKKLGWKEDKGSREYQEWSEEWGRAVFRVLHPGGHMLAMGHTRLYPRMVCGLEDAGFQVRDALAWVYGSGMPKSRNSLKPGYDPISLVRKPFRGSERAQMERTGTGGLYPEACRVPWLNEEDRAQAEAKNRHSTFSNPNSNRDTYNGNMPARFNYDGSRGRWASNLLLSEESLQELGPDGRYFYCAKVQARDRQWCTHPTMKPLDLFCWMVRLVTPPEGVVLDPFVGSGTLLEAARREGRRAIGIESDANCLPWIEIRMSTVPQFLGATK